LPTPIDCCPECGYFFDHATEIEGSGAQPTPGAFTICLQCAALLRYQLDMRTALATEAELSLLEPGQQRMIERARQLIRSRSRPLSSQRRLFD